MTEGEDCKSSNLSLQVAVIWLKSQERSPLHFMTRIPQFSPDG